MSQNEQKYLMMTINSNVLETPRSYQRKIDHTRVKHIADEFSEYIANEPKVSYRDGHYYVFDGQHTIAARRLRNNNKDLPIRCKVYHGLTEKDEARLFAIQTGESADLTPGAKLRANVCGDDPEALAFIDATNSEGIDIDYDRQRGTNRIGCVATAFSLYETVGEEDYRDGLEIILEAWNGDPESLRAETLSGVIQFVHIYHGEYDRGRLIKLLSKTDPLSIYRKGKLLGVDFPGTKKYIFEVWSIYNASRKKQALPIKF